MCGWGPTLVNPPIITRGRPASTAEQIVSSISVPMSVSSPTVRIDRGTVPLKLHRAVHYSTHDALLGEQEQRDHGKTTQEHRGQPQCVLSLVPREEP